MFHSDYLSCFLTALATALVGWKAWAGLLISIVNCMVVGVRGFRTFQFGFIPANLICIVYTRSASGLGSRRLTRIGSVQRWGLGPRRRQWSTLAHSDRLGTMVCCQSTKLSLHCANKRGIMNRNPTPFRQTSVTSLQVGNGLACLTLLLSLGAGSMGRTQSQAQSRVPGAAIRVTHVLGFEGARQNATGDLKIQGDAMLFQKDGSPTAQVNISSIQDIFVENEDKQVGGTAMTLGKTAAPYGGGRVVSLFAHKKYDFLTVEYLDDSGGFHGAIFQLAKGEGQTFKKVLVANGAHTSSPDDRATTQSTPEVKHENK